MTEVRTYKYFSSLDASGALLMAVEGYAALLREGLADPHYNMLSGTYKTVTCSTKRRGIIGLICFDEWNTPERFWIYFAYVKPECRRRGVYRGMWNHLLDIAKASNVKSIGSATYVENEPMKATYEALGRRARSITYEYEVTT